MPTDERVVVTVEVGGDRYSCSPRPTGWVATKEGSTETYFVADLGTCSCKGFQYRGACKHLAAFRELGLTPKNLPEPSNDGPRGANKMV